MLCATHIAVHATVFVLAYLCALDVFGLMPLWEASSNDAVVPRKLVREIQICSRAVRMFRGTPLPLMQLHSPQWIRENCQNKGLANAE